jgi:rhodanese-related sulfurtransferase
MDPRAFQSPRGTCPEMKSISVDELEGRLKSGTPFLLDVRELEEMADGTIAGSVNIPMGEVEQRLREIPADRDIVVICHLGARSGYITKRLNALGYDRAMNLRGGMEAWLAESSRAND